MTPFRLTAATLALASLTACGGGGDLAVRNGPQEVHPSPSRLASGAVAATPKAHVTSVQQITVINVTVPCTAQQTCHNGHHHNHKYDGSRPIVD